MKKLLEIAGAYVIGSIEENIRKGIGYEGERFSYSIKPFFRPFDPVIYKKIKKAPEIAEVRHSNRTGKLGFIVFGYKKFKAYLNPSAANDFLTWSGQMLRDMKVLKVSETEAIIGFSDPKQAQKAFWFNVSGVGRSRKLWKFLGITRTQKQKLAERLGESYKKIVLEELGKIIHKGK